MGILKTIINFLNSIVLFFTTCFYNRPGFSKFPPGPISIPFFGNSRLLKKLSVQHGGLPGAFEELSKQYNTDILGVTIAGNYTVVIQSETLIEDVLNDNLYTGRPDNFFLRLRSMGKKQGITMTDGALWNEQRTFAMKHLHDQGFGTSRMEFMIKKQCEGLLLDLGNCDISSLALRKFIAKCVLNVLWEIVTGTPFQDEETMYNLMSLMEKRAKLFDMSGGTLSQFPWIRFILPNYTGYNLIKNLNKQFKKMIVEIIDDHKMTYELNQPRDFIDKYLHAMFLNNVTHSTFTQDQLVMVCLDFFIGGSQTTSSTLDFCFLYMTLYPDIQDKVQKELDDVLSPGQIPSLSDRDRCPYIQAVLLEIQRIVPVGPIIGPRRALSDAFLNGYYIPKDTTILINIQHVHRNPKHWEDPEIFKPERFLDEERKPKLIKKLYNFGKGKRRCPADNLAKASLFILFCGVLHNYKLQVVDKENPPLLKTIPGITVTPVEYSVKLVKRFS